MADGGSAALRQGITQWGLACFISQLDQIGSTNSLFFVLSSAQVISLYSPIGSQFLEFHNKYAGEAKLTSLRTQTMRRLWLTGGVPPDRRPPHGRNLITPLHSFTPFLL